MTGQPSEPLSREELEAEHQRLRDAFHERFVRCDELEARVEELKRERDEWIYAAEGAIDRLKARVEELERKLSAAEGEASFKHDRMAYFEAREAKLREALELAANLPTWNRPMALAKDAAREALASFPAEGAEE